MPFDQNYYFFPNAPSPKCQLQKHWHTKP